MDAEWTKEKKMRRRWSDNDKNFGPFTYAAGGYHGLGATFVTACGDPDGEHGACLRLHALKRTLIVWLPFALRRFGEYGAVLVDQAVHFHYGPQTFDSSTTKSKCWFVPWLNWRHVRNSLYGLDGKYIVSQDRKADWLVWYEQRKLCPSASFVFDDFDGERIVAKTYIDEMEWRLGTGWFKWLSLFCRSKVRRTLEIEFSKETGKRKGSWKGGTIGHGIEMLPGELHEAAFRRYCSEHAMTFVGPIPLSPPPAAGAVEEGK